MSRAQFVCMGRKSIYKTDILVRSHGAGYVRQSVPLFFVIRRIDVLLVRVIILVVINKTNNSNLKIELCGF
jgi:hypothetical protein